MTHSDEALRKGIIAELVAQQHWLGEGHHILTPITNDTKFDFVAYKDGDFVRVQVKCAILSRYKSGCPSLWRARNKRGQNADYELDDYDVLHVVRVLDNTQWVIPHAVVEGMQAVTLCREDGKDLRSNTKTPAMGPYKVTNEKKGKTWNETH